jgi:phosphate transport system protein
MAHDLRLIIAAMKISSDLERIADQAVNIWENTRELLEFPELKPLIDIPRMAEISKGMVRDSLDAFVESDAAKARETVLRDDEVDGLKDQVFRELLTYMISDPKTIQVALQLILVARHLERIADHATNICEDVVYLVEAKDIRHHAEEGKV